MSQALGRSFKHHLLGGYHFLMRHYRKDTEIYIFGFSRGAYTACFLAEMLDYSGLLGPDNEEMIPFIWKAFSDFKLVRFQTDMEKKKDAVKFLKSCRDTLSRAAARVKFLGVFDTVNSVAEFEVDNKFGDNANVTRHAVSIDERRVKFQPVLLKKRRQRHRRHPRLWNLHHHLEKKPDSNDPQPAVPPSETTHCKESDKPSEKRSTHVQSQENQDGKADDVQDKESTTDEPDDDEVDELEVWFPGCHADVGGGNKMGDKEIWQLSHAPLVWMVQEATKAGLRFDWTPLKLYNCLEPPEESAERRDYLDALYHSSATGILNDRLKSGSGVSMISALAWNILEYIPIRHVEIQKDGGSTTMHFPLHLGEPRGVPLDALVHVSAIRRMQHNTDYRPGNLIVGGGGREVLKAPPELGLGDWVAKYNIDDPAQELYVRMSAQFR